jgi:hypothetical protein
MKSIYSSLVALVVFAMFAALAVADPGTTWDKQIVGEGRFSVLSQFGNAAVFDRETGRVWERSPGDVDGDGDVDDDDRRNWYSALSHCYTLEIGGRKGWRLPTIEELASLVDTSQAAPTLPASHPFTNVQSFFYWSATTSATLTSTAWGVFFSNGNVVFDVKSDSIFVWCVRGGQGIDGV